MNLKYVTTSALPKALKRLTAVRADKKQAEADWKDGSQRVIQLLKAVGLTTFTTKDGITATITPVNEVVFDEEAFLDNLDVSQVVACTRSKVDKEALAQAVADGIIDQGVVDKYTSKVTKGEKITLTINKAVN